MAGESITNRATSDSATHAFKLLDLRLKSISADLKFPSPRRPLELSASVNVDISRISEFVTYDVAYALEVHDKESREVLRADITLNLLFRIKDGADPSEEEIRSFGTYGSVDIAHPYMREIVQTLTGRMNLPPLVLDVRAPEPAEL